MIELLLAQPALRPKSSIYRRFRLFATQAILAEHVGHTREHWPEVVVVLTAT